MNVLLISMPDISPAFRPWKALGPNMALCSIAGNLDPKHQVRIADLVLKRNHLKQAIEEALQKVNPDLVGLSAMTFQYDTALKIAQRVKRCRPEVKVALGGYHATLMYREIADGDEGKVFDFLFRGEADRSFGEAVEAIETTRDFRSIDGISFKENGVFVHNQERNLEDLSQIMLPKREVRLWRGYHLLGEPYEMIETSRGCTKGCTFCSIRHMYGRSFRAYDLSRVIADIAEAKKNGAKTIFITDDNITLHLNRLESLLDQIISAGHNDLGYMIQGSSEGIASSEQLIKKMAAAGIKHVFLGIENVSQKNLKTLRKGNIFEKSVRAVKLLKQNEIVVTGGLIIGNPDDDASDIEENYRFAYRMDISVYDQILTPYPKTEVRKDLLERQLITNPNNYKLYDGHFANVRTYYLSDQELNFLKYKMVQNTIGLCLKCFLI